MESQKCEEEASDFTSGTESPECEEEVGDFATGMESPEEKQHAIHFVTGIESPDCHDQAILFVTGMESPEYREEAGDFTSGTESPECEEEVGDFNTGVESPEEKQHAIHFVTGIESPQVQQEQAEIRCDNCGSTKPIRVWRWCRDCALLLCETCIVDDHFDHAIDSYATAVRRYAEEYRKIQGEIEEKAQKLQQNGAAVREIKGEIIAKLKSIKGETRAKMDEGRDVEDTLREYLASMITLKNRPLNANTWLERQQMKTGVKELVKMAWTKQEDTEEYLKKLDISVDNGTFTLIQLFREEN